jgi:hypothetical protein
MLHAIQSIKPSQLLDHQFYNFKELEKERDALTEALVED